MLLADLLKLPVLSKAQAIAGADGLSNREVLSVNIMDAPDIVTFLKKGDLLLTNGYLLKDRPEKFAAFIAGMHRKGCAGLAIKTRRFSLSIPRDALEEADKLGFPILELSMIEATLGDLFQQTTGILLDNKNEELHYALTVHKQFADMVVQGEGLSTIIGKLAALLQSPVLLLDDKRRQLAASPHFDHPELNELPSQAAEAAASLPMELASHAALCFPHARPAELRHADVIPIHTFRREGHLLAFHGGRTRPGPELLAFEQAAHVIGLELAKKHAVKERSRRYKNDFFSDLIEGYVSTEQEALHRGAKYGLRAGRPAILVLAKEDGAERKGGSRTAEERLSAERDRHYEVVKQALSLLEEPFVLFSKNDLIGALFFHDPENWNEATFLKRLEEAARLIDDREGIGFSFGVGNPIASALDLGLSYREALQALASGRRMHRKRFAQLYRTMDFGRLLRMLPYEEMERYYLEAFKDLLGRGGHDRAELIRTLKAYYDNHCNLVDTAKALYVHRNTVVYRLEKCEKLTGRSLKDAEAAFGFQVAFAIEPMLKRDPFGR
jgi:Regulator of polyketide synthase expression